MIDNKQLQTSTGKSHHLVLISIYLFDIFDMYQPFPQHIHIIYCLVSIHKCI